MATGTNDTVDKLQTLMDCVFQRDNKIWQMVASRKKCKEMVKEQLNSRNSEIEKLKGNNLLTLHELQNANLAIRHLTQTNETLTFQIETAERNAEMLTVAFQNQSINLKANVDKCEILENKLNRCNTIEVTNSELKQQVGVIVCENVDLQRELRNTQQTMKDIEIRCKEIFDECLSELEDALKMQENQSIEIKRLSYQMKLKTDALSESQSIAEFGSDSPTSSYVTSEFTRPKSPVSRIPPPKKLCSDVTDNIQESISPSITK